MKAMPKEHSAEGMTWRKYRPGLILLFSSMIIISLIAAAGYGWMKEPAPRQASASGQAMEEDGTAATGDEAALPAQEGQSGAAGETSGQGENSVESAATGEDYAYVTPTQRYVDETQSHQNFLAAVAAGDVRRMDFMSTDFQPVDDPNSSYITFSLARADGGRSTGTLVMKFESGMWRLAAVRQLSGNLGGGTNYLVPAGFEDEIAAELAANQPFFTKLAEGRVSALIVDDDQHPSETESVLTGRVVGRSGRSENTIMYLRKDYNIWHLSGFDYR